MAKSFEAICRARSRIMQLLDFIFCWLKTHTLPGFFGVPVWDVGRFFVEEIRKDDPVIRASAVAFSFFLSLFPAALTLFTLLPYMPLPESFMATLNDTVRSVLPGMAGDWLIGLFDDIANRQRRGLLSFSTLLFLLFSTGGMVTLMGSFEKQYHEIYSRRNPLIKRAVALGLTALLGSLVFLSVGLVIAGRHIMDFAANLIHLDEFAQAALGFFRWGLVVTLFAVSISLLYRFGVKARVRMRFFNTGATVATFLAVTSSFLFSLYIDSFGAYNKLYGSIGAVMVTMLWLQINAFALIAGYELNTAILFQRFASEKVRASTDGRQQPAP